jgi:N-acetylglucosamine-6-phosphate deacetylase
MKYWILCCFFLLNTLTANDVICFYNARLIKDHQLIKEDLWIQNGKIIPEQETADQSIDVQGQILAPGYIDLQLNGAFGIDFSVQPEKVTEVAAQLPRFGVTAFLPTLISLPKENYPTFINHLKLARSNGSEILGVHLEGPFFAFNKRGAHRPEFIQSIDTSVESFYGDLSFVKIVTLAPELSNALSFIEDLKAKGICISAGHTEANYQEAKRGISAGVTMATHLFNAMAPINHRSPNLVTAFLTDEKLYYSVIADGIHLDPAIIRLAWKSNPEGLILITDAMEALGQKEGVYKLGTMDVKVENGKATILGTETIAGSVISLDAAVRYFYQTTKCSLVEAIEAASLKPAEVLGLKNKGHLQIDADADFIILDEELNVRATYVKGIKLYSQD